MRGVRFIVLVLTTLCLTSILSNMNTYNFTKICLDPSVDNSANYSTFEKTAIQSCTAVGSLAASIPLVMALERFPKKFVFIAAGVISIVATALIPLAESLGFGYFLAVRIFQGVAFSTTFPMSGALTSEWAALSEHGIFLAFLTGFSQLSNIFTMPVAGALCSSSLGWRSVYYVHAGVGLVVFLLFALLFQDRPQEHRLVSAAEREWILQGREEKASESSRRRSPVPYRAVFSSLTIWGVWASGFADILAIQFIAMFQPQYLNNYLEYDVLKTGFLAALPVIVQWLFKVFAGVSSDLLKCIGETVKLRIYNSFALWLSAAFFIVLSFMDKSQPVLCLVILVSLLPGPPNISSLRIVTEGFMGFNTAGFNKCGTLHARQHAHFVMVQIMNIQSICILVEPFIVNAILTDNSAVQWRLVFLIHAAILVAANVLFVVFADSRPAPWTREEMPPIEEGNDGKWEVDGVELRRKTRV